MIKMRLKKLPLWAKLFRRKLYVKIVETGLKDDEIAISMYKLYIPVRSPILNPKIEESEEKEDEILDINTEDV